MFKVTLLIMLLTVFMVSFTRAFVTADKNPQKVEDLSVVVKALENKVINIIEVELIHGMNYALEELSATLSAKLSESVKNFIIIATDKVINESIELAEEAGQWIINQQNL
jgi:hypothetical protein